MIILLVRCEVPPGSHVSQSNDIAPKHLAFVIIPLIILIEPELKLHRVHILVTYQMGLIPLTIRVYGIDINLREVRILSQVQTHMLLVDKDREGEIDIDAGIDIDVLEHDLVLKTDGLSLFVEFESGAYLEDHC